MEYHRGSSQERLNDVERREREEGGGGTSARCVSAVRLGIVSLLMEVGGRGGGGRSGR